MRTIPTLITLAVLAASSSAAAEHTDILTDQIIVKYRSSVPEMLANTLPGDKLSHLQQVISADVSYVRQSGNSTHILKVRDRQQLDAVIEQLRQDPNVTYAEPDRIMWPTILPNDPYFNYQWHYNSATSGINLPLAWDLTTGGPEVTVAVIDTGVRLEHPDLMNNLLPGYDFIKNANAARDGDGRDADPTDEGDWMLAGQCGNNYPPQNRNSSWHGTHVAGTIAAEGNNGQGLTGVAWSAGILPVRVLGACGGYTSDITDGMRWAAGLPVNGVPANPYPAKVLNLSLGGQGACGYTYQQTINAVRAKGSTVIVAAGNSNQDVRNFSPGNCQGVISVAANNKEGNRAFYSNYGNLIDITAPGGGRSGGILSTYNSGQREAGNSSYGYSMGTSMAAPHIAGIAALMYSLNSTLTPDQIEHFIKSSARPFPSGSNCNTSICGSGMADTLAALQHVSGIISGHNPSPDTVNCSALPAWDVSKIYLDGHKVQHNGSAYEAKWWTAQQAPTAHSKTWDVWNNLGQCN